MRISNCGFRIKKFAIDNPHSAIFIMIRLGVNIDHVASLRQARKTPYPDILEAARLAKAGGADQITVHLREDRRHIQDKDLIVLKKNIDLPLNLEMAAVDEIVAIAIKISPASVTIVPEKRQEQTTESGLDLAREFQSVAPRVERLKKAQINVSLFIEPDEEQVRAAHELRVSAVEFHTGPYALRTSVTSIEHELERIRRTAILAKDRKLKVAAGHGLHYENTKIFVRAVPEIEELNIGHSIVARAIFVGLEKAVREMKDLLP